MGIYKNNKEGFKTIQKKLLRNAIPIVSLALAVGLLISYNQNDDGQVNTLPYVLIIAIGAGGFGIFKGLNRQRQLFESYTLTVDENSIQREQFNTPTVTISRSEIQEILKDETGGFAVKGKSRTEVIIVSNQIENIEALERELQQLGEIKLQQGKSTVERLRFPIVLIGLVMMATVYISTNRYLVLCCGSILALGLMYSIYEVQTSKTVDKKTKRISWWTVIVIIAVIGITYSKFVG
jgi:hypothetical protein